MQIRKKLNVLQVLIIMLSFSVFYSCSKEKFNPTYSRELNNTWLKENHHFSTYQLENFSQLIDVKTYGAVGDGITDDTVAIQEAIDNVKLTGGIVFLPVGTYKITESLNLTNIGDISIKIVGASSRNTIISAHLNKAVFDCTGSQFLQFWDFMISGNSVTMPETAFLFARNNSHNSAGINHLYNIWTLGYFSVAALYNYASEEFRATDCYFTNNQPDAKVVVITRSNVFNLTSNYAQIDSGSQSTTEYKFMGCSMNNYATNGAANDSLYLEGVSSLSSDTYMSNNFGRSFIYIDATKYSSTNLAFKNSMWDGAATTYGIYLTGANEVAYIIVENIMDYGVKSYETGGRTFYGEDNSMISNLYWRNVYGTAKYLRTFQCICSDIVLNPAEAFYNNYIFSNNRIVVNSTLITLLRPDLAVNNQVFYSDTGVLSNLLDGTLVWDPASLPDNAAITSGQIIIQGASFGNFVMVAAPYDLQGLICTGYVESANIIKIHLFNKTGNSINLPSGTWKVKVLR